MRSKGTRPLLFGGTTRPPTDFLDMSMTTSTTPCLSLLESLMPVEIMEIIIGNLDFRSLPKLLATSRRIRRLFQSCRYASQMGCIVKYERDGLRTVYREMQKHPATIWTVQEVLHAFIDQHCQCGNYGFILLWASLPPKKLCVYCNDKLEFIDLAIGISHFGLVPSEVETIPKFRANESMYVLVESLRTLALSKREAGSDRPADSVLRSPRCARTSGQLATELCFRRVPWKYPGRITMAALDPPRDCAYRYFCCDYCLQGVILLDTYVPWNYDALRGHVERKHPERLEQFLAGWNVWFESSPEAWTKEGKIKPYQNTSRRIAAVVRT